MSLRLLPDRWFVVISDENGRIVVDTSSHGSQAGETLSREVAAFYAGHDQGFGRTRYRDKDILLGFVRPERTGWFIGVGMPSWVVYGPLLGSIGELIARGKTRPRAAQNHDRNIRIAICFLQRLENLFAQEIAQRIAFLRPIERNPPHAQ